MSQYLENVDKFKLIKDQLESVANRVWQVRIDRNEAGPLVAYWDIIVDDELTASAIVQDLEEHFDDEDFIVYKVNKSIYKII